MRQTIIIVAGGIVLVLLIIRELIDLAATLDYIEQKFPRLIKWAERKSWQRILLLVLTIMYAGILYELFSEKPEIQIAKLPSADEGAKDAQIIQLMQQLSAKTRVVTVITEPRWKTFKLTPVYNQNFHDELIELDGKDVWHCTFNNVTFLYHGLKPFSFHDNKLSGNLWVRTGNNAILNWTQLLREFKYLSPTLPPFEYVGGRVDKNGR